MNKRSEYEIQHFDFSAEQITLERKELLKKIIDNALEVMLEKLPVPISDNTKALLAQQKAEVSKLINKDFEEDLQAMAEMDKKTFAIPDHVLLPTDFGLAKQYKQEDFKEMDEKVADLKKQFLQNCFMIETLKMENARYKSIETFINDELKLHEQVLESFKTVDFKKMHELMEKTKHLLKLDDKDEPQISHQMQETCTAADIERMQELMENTMNMMKLNDKTD